MASICSIASIWSIWSMFRSVGIVGQESCWGYGGTKRTEMQEWIHRPIERTSTAACWTRERQRAPSTVHSQTQQGKKACTTFWGSPTTASSLTSLFKRKRVGGSQGPEETSAGCMLHRTEDIFLPGSKPSLAQNQGWHTCWNTPQRRRQHCSGGPFFSTSAKNLDFLALGMLYCAIWDVVIWSVRGIWHFVLISEPIELLNVHIWLCTCMAEDYSWTDPSRVSLDFHSPRYM